MVMLTATFVPLLVLRFLGVKRLGLMSLTTLDRNDGVVCNAGNIASI